MKTRRELAHLGVHYRNDEEACLELAIRFRPILGDVPLAAVMEDSCSGCTACPQRDIDMREPVGGIS
ncbi:MAG: hypothetical protein EA400_09575 [Chromatiaceae bacterium]|nr:MAG: hypothetical protein EA400_09575 [Chromatiaceae bacterium]